MGSFFYLEIDGGIGWAKSDYFPKSMFLYNLKVYCYFPLNNPHSVKCESELGKKTERINKKQGRKVRWTLEDEEKNQ